MRITHYITDLHSAPATVVLADQDCVAEAVEGREHGDAVAAVVFVEVGEENVAAEESGGGVEEEGGGGYWEGFGWRLRFGVGVGGCVARRRTAKPYILLQLEPSSSAEAISKHCWCVLHHLLLPKPLPLFDNMPSSVSMRWSLEIEFAHELARVDPRVAESRRHD